MAYRPRHWQVFDEQWFTRNQRWLRWCVNMPIVGRWFRRMLSLRLALPVTLITPDAVH
jgi:type II secretory pathway component PulF